LIPTTFIGVFFSYQDLEPQLSKCQSKRSCDNACHYNHTNTNATKTLKLILQKWYIIDLNTTISLHDHKK